MNLCLCDKQILRWNIVCCFETAVEIKSTMWNLVGENTTKYNGLRVFTIVSIIT